LYYFGARYYDPRTSVWQSADPALGDFLAGRQQTSPRHLSLYAYGAGNPMRLVDPNGMNPVGKEAVLSVLDQVMPAGAAAVKLSNWDPIDLSDHQGALVAKAIDVSDGMLNNYIETGVDHAGKAADAHASGDTVGTLAYGYSAFENLKTAALGVAVGFAEGAAESPGVAKAGTKGLSLIDRAINLVKPCACFVAGTPVLVDGEIVPIESLKVGDRVEAGDPSCADEHLDPSDRVIHLQAANPLVPGDVLNLTFVRPLTWLDERGFVDGVGWLALEELDFAGWATVVGIEDAPHEAAGDGCLVLMTLEYTAERVVKITLEGGTPLELTPRHPVYLERGGWTPAGAIRVGQVLRSDRGPLSVRAVDDSAQGQRVFNIQVDRQHAYRISDLGIWSHNAGCDVRLPRVLEAALDRTGKVHGPLPKPLELGKYSRDDLTQLLGELKQGVKERIRLNAERGADPGHAARQREEQTLISRITKLLEDD
jgi:RHS repeat-associated protein